MRQARRFWAERLARERSPSGLPLDKPRPTSYRCETSAVTFAVSGPLREAIRRLTGDRPLLVCALVMAAAGVVLQKVTGAQVIAIGTPGRREHGQATALPIVIDLDPTRSMRTLLMDIKQSLGEAYAHEEYPYDAIVRDVGVEQPGAKCPLFDVSVSFDGFHGPLPDTRHDAAIHLTCDDTSITGRVEYNALLFERATMTQFSERVVRVLGATLADPNALVARMDVLTPEERARLARWAREEVLPVPDECLSVLIEAQVDRAPNATAVSFQGRSLTYGELDQRANRLAWRLRSLGVGPDVLVGLCTQPCLARAVAILAILKAGGAFLPIDTEHPPERLTQMLAEAQPALIVLTSAHKPRIPHGSTPVIEVDEEGRDGPDGNDARLPQTATGDHLAYVIYTSGSTGRPKGVACHQRGLANLAVSQVRALGVTPGSRVLQFASISFDAAVSEIAMALGSGATLLLEPREATLPGEVLLGTLASLAVTHVTLVPSVLSLLPAATLPALSTLIVAGEACPAELVQQWAPGRRFFNAYGPSEVTVCATLHECRDVRTRPAIGRPMANMEVYILDPQLSLVPPGGVGELCIGGTGVARGYLHNPPATAERFVPHPYGQAGERLYRSGDLARFLPDGTIDFEGRADTQVKIRGFRIELEEIEQALLHHPGVREAAVVVREDTPGRKRLVAYVTPAASTSEPLTDAALRGHLRDLLPDYMVPEACVVLPELPKTSKHTIAKQRLPPPGDATDTAREIERPRDAVELELVQIWERLLSRSPIGIRDNFFDLGGHSFLLVTLLSEIRAHFDSDLPLPAILDAPVIEQLATLIRDRRETGPWSPIVALQPRGDRQPMFCVHPAGGTVLCYAELAAALGTDRPFHGLQAFGLEEGQVPLKTVEEMAALYVESIRTSNVPEPYLLSGWSAGGPIAFEMARQLTADGARIGLLAMFDSYAPAALSVPAEQDDVQRLINLFGEMNLPEEQLRAMSPDGRLEYVLDLGQKADLLPPGFRLSDARRLFDVFSAISAAMPAYTPRPYDGSILLFSARSEVARSVENPDDPSNGWEQFARGGVKVHAMDCTHVELMRQPHVQQVADEITKAAAALPRGGPTA